MSIAALLWAADQKAPSLGATATLFVLANKTNINGQAWPSQQYLTDRVNASERSIGKYLSELEAAGLISRDRIVETFTIKGRVIPAFIPKSVVYRLAIDDPKNIPVRSEEFSDVRSEESADYPVRVYPVSEDSKNPSLRSGIAREESDLFGGEIQPASEGKEIQAGPAPSQSLQVARLGVRVTASSVPDAVPIAGMIAAYHSGVPSGKKVMLLPQSRVASLTRIWRDLGRDLGQWVAYLRKVEASDFLTGRKDTSNGPFTGLSIDWICGPKNFTKIIEGNYDNKQSSGPGARPTPGRPGAEMWPNVR